MRGESAYLAILAFLQWQSAGAEILKNDFQVKPSGEIRISGLLSPTVNSEEFRIGTQSFQFSSALEVNGTRFDDLSKKALTGAQIDALLEKSDRGVELTAAIPSGLFSVLPFKTGSMSEDHFRRSFSEQPGKFAEGSAHREYLNYRKTLVVGDVKPGELALIISFSGAQGDDPTAILGHFAFGQAVVGPSGELSGEINNFYPVKNEKQLQPGFMDPIDYFGNLTGGQSQYRATYTMIVYGLAPASILRAKEEIKKTFSYLDSHPDFQVVASYNCTTQTCRALQVAGLDLNATSDSRALIPVESLTKKYAGTDASASGWQRFLYFLFTDRSQIFPRVAFENALSTALSKGVIGHEKFTRLDYVYQGQLPSARARGDLAAGSISQYVLSYVKMLAR